MGRAALRNGGETGCSDQSSYHKIKLQDVVAREVLKIIAPHIPTHEKPDSAIVPIRNTIHELVEDA